MNLQSWQKRLLELVKQAREEFNDPQSDSGERSGEGGVSDADD